MTWTAQPIRCLAIGRYTYRHTGIGGFTKHAVEMSSDATMYKPNFINIGSSIPKLIESDT
jgi:hypothetical protein